MSALPPVFVEFLASIGQFKASAAEVIAETKTVEDAGGSSFAKMGAFATNALLAIGAAAVVAGVKGVGMATTFQSQMELLVTSCGESQSAVKSLGNGVLAIAQATGESTDQLTSGLYVVEKAGYRSSDALKVTKAAAEGAVAEGTDMTTMTNALTSVMATYHLKASDAVSTTNELVAAAGESKTSMQDYAGALSTVLPKAQAAGLSFAQVGGAIATLTQHGTSAQEATQELANTIGSLQNPSQVAQNEMQQLGLNVNDMTSKLGSRGLTGTLQMYVQAVAKNMGPSGQVLMNSFKESQSAGQDLQTMLGSMSPKLKSLSQGFLDGSVSAADYKKDIKALGAEGYSQGTQFMSLADKASGFNDLLKSGSPAAQTMTAALSKMMGGTTGLNTALMLTGDNMPGFEQRVAAIGAAGKKTGSDISTWSKTQETLKVKLQQAKEIIQAALIKTGEVLIPILTNVVGWLIKHKSAIGDVVAVLGIMAAVFGTVKVAIGAYNVIMGIARGAALLFGSAAEEADAAMDANPIGAIIMAITALIVIIIEVVKHWKTISTTVEQVWHDVTSWVSKIWNDVTGWFAKIWDDVTSWVSKIWHDVVGFFVSIYDDVMHWVGSLWSDVTGAFSAAGTWLTQIGSDIINGLWTGIKFMANLVYDWYVKWPLQIIGLLADAGSWLVGVGKNMITGIWNGMVNMAGGLWNWISGIPGQVWNLLSTLYDNALTIGTNLVKGLWNGMVNMADWIWDQIKKFCSNIVGGIKSFFGIASPSKVMADMVGKNLALGVAQGVTDNQHHAINAMKTMAQGINNVDFTAPATGGLGMAGITGGSGSAPVTNVTVNVAGTVQSEQDLANTIQKQFLQSGARRGATKTYQAYARG